MINKQSPGEPNQVDGGLAEARLHLAKAIPAFTTRIEDAAASSHQQGLHLGQILEKHRVVRVNDADHQPNVRDLP